MSEPNTLAANAVKPSGIDVSIIVVSYGTREMTLSCLLSLVEQTKDLRYEVIVVDNGSADGSPEAIAQRFPHFRLLAQSENLGFAAANNLAAKLAVGEFLLLLNPDTVVLDRAIDKLVAFARERPRAGIWGGRTLFGDGQLNPNSCWRRETLWSLFCRSFALSMMFPNSPLLNPEAYGGWRRDAEREVDIVTGCFFLVRRELWEALGGFDPDFFMYGEEADLCLRARAMGVRPAVTPDATIVHYGGGTEKNNFRKNRRMLAAKALLIRRHFSRPAVPIGLALLALRPLIKTMSGSAAERQGWKTIWSERHAWLAGRF
jgi:GT2 family glycosyltransferase